MERASAEQWAERVKRWRDSGLTAKEFAAEAGVNASTLSYWRWKLGSGHKDTDASSARERRCGRKANAKRQRVETTSKAAVLGESVQFFELPTATLASCGPALELVLGREVSVRVPVGFDETTLTRVVRAVEAAR